MPERLADAIDVLSQARRTNASTCSAATTPPATEKTTFLSAKFKCLRASFD